MRPAAGAACHVRLQGVVRSFPSGFGRLTVLAGVDFEVEPGSFVALHGRSGSGKSTLLHLLAGVDRPEAGSVVVAGRALERLGEPELARYRREMVGAVFQHQPMMPSLSAIENVALPLELSGTARARALDTARGWLDDLGIAHRADHPVEGLSGGERQRVALARAMVRGAPLLLVDEPTAGLDSLAGDEVMNVIRAVAGAAGRTVVIATHDARAAAFADRVVTLRQGRIMEGGRARAVHA